MFLISTATFQTNNKFIYKYPCTVKILLISSFTTSHIGLSLPENGYFNGSIIHYFGFRIVKATFKNYFEMAGRFATISY